MKVTGFDRRAHERSLASGKNGYLGSTGDLANHAGVARSQRSAHVAGYRGDAQQLKLGRCECQQQRDTVIDTGIAIDDDSSHGASVIGACVIGGGRARGGGSPDPAMRGHSQASSASVLPRLPTVA